MRKLLILMLVVAAPVAAQAPSGAAEPGLPLASFDTAWASIARTYYDTTLINGRWAAARDSLRGALGAEPSDEAVRRAILALIAIPGQSHFALIPREVSLPTAEASRDGAPGTTGLELRMVGDTLVVWRVAPGSPAAAAGVRPGWAVTHLDTLAVATIREGLAKAFPDDPKHLRTLLVALSNARVRLSALDTARLTVQDFAGRPRQLALAHIPLSGQLTRFGNLPPQVIRVTLDTVTAGRGRQAVGIPVVSWSAWFPVISPTLDSVLFSLRDAPGLVIDLRGNPGGVIGMISGVAGHFSDSMVNLGTMYGRGSTLFLRANPRVVDRAGARVGVITAPVAILVDGATASNSEFFAAGMQGLGRARVFGEASSGQALPALMLRLPSGDVLMHPIADHEDANGRRVEGVGVQPDVVTPLTRRALRDGRDPALEAAVDWLARTVSR